MESRFQKTGKRWYLKRLKIYFALAKIEWVRILNYRMSMIVYRIGNVAEILVQLIIWTAIFKSADIVKGYSYDEMITYIIIGYFIAFLSANYQFDKFVADDIHTGRLSNILVKPMSFLRYMTARSFGRVTFTVSSLIMNVIFILLLWQHILPPDNWKNLLIMALMVIIAYFIKLFVALLVGMTAFWFKIVSGIRSSTNHFIKLMAGGYFPINILPSFYIGIGLAFPFAYGRFVPMQLYLGKMTFVQGLYGLGIEIIWLFILYGIIKVVWKRGLKKYEGAGI